MSTRPIVNRSDVPPMVWQELYTDDNEDVLFSAGPILDESRIESDIQKDINNYA